MGGAFLIIDMKVKANVDFFDVHAKKGRKKDEVFEVSDSRGKALTKKVKGKSACSTVK